MSIGQLKSINARKLSERAKVHARRMRNAFQGEDARAASWLTGYMEALSDMRKLASCEAHNNQIRLARLLAYLEEQP